MTAAQDRHDAETNGDVGVTHGASTTAPGPDPTDSATPAPTVPSESALEQRVRTLEEESEHTTEAVDDVGYAVEVLAGVDGRLRADLALGLAEIGRWLTWLAHRVAHEDAQAENDHPAPPPNTDSDGDGR